MKRKYEGVETNREEVGEPPLRKPLVRRVIKQPDGSLQVVCCSNSLSFPFH